MKKRLIFRSLIAVVVIVAVIASLGGAFIDNDEDSLPDFQLDALPAFFPTFDCFFIFTGYSHPVPQPLIPESSANFIEMHEKSPPLTAPLFYPI